MSKSGGKACICGCSSMAEQKLPKLLTSADLSHLQSKTPQETPVLNQTVGFSVQNKNDPRADGNPSEGLTLTHGGAQMAVQSDTRKTRAVEAAGDQALLSELARVKAMFQLRAIALHMGVSPDILAEITRLSPVDAA